MFNDFKRYRKSTKWKVSVSIFIVGVIFVTSIFRLTGNQLYLYLIIFPCGVGLWAILSQYRELKGLYELRIEGDLITAKLFGYNEFIESSFSQVEKIDSKIENGRTLFTIKFRNEIHLVKISDELNGYEEIIAQFKKRGLIAI